MNLQNQNESLFVEVHTGWSPIFGTMLVPFKEDIKFLLEQKMKKQKHLDDELLSCLNNRQLLVEQFIEWIISLEKMTPFIDEHHDKLDLIEEIEKGNASFDLIIKDWFGTKIKNQLTKIFSRR